LLVPTFISEEGEALTANDRSRVNGLLAGTGVEAMLLSE
jgi:hypothetical protein